MRDLPQNDEHLHGGDVKIIGRIPVPSMKYLAHVEDGRNEGKED